MDVMTFYGDFAISLFSDFLKGVSICLGTTEGTHNNLTLER